MRPCWNLAPVHSAMGPERAGSGGSEQTVPAAGVEPAAPSSSGRCSTTELHRRRSEPAVGLEPTPSALRERRSACRASPAFGRVAGGSRTHTTPVHSRVPLPLWVRPQSPWQESNLHNLRLRRAACLRHTPGTTSSTPARSRTWTCSFGGSHDVLFTTRVTRSGGWGRTSVRGFRARRPTLRRPRKESI